MFSTMSLAAGGKQTLQGRRWEEKADRVTVRPWLCYLHTCPFLKAGHQPNVSGCTWRWQRFLWIQKEVG